MNAIDKSVPVMRQFCKVTPSEENRLTAALMVDTACLSKAATMG